MQACRPGVGETAVAALLLLAIPLMVAKVLFWLASRLAKSADATYGRGSAFLNRCYNVLCLVIVLACLLDEMLCPRPPYPALLHAHLSSSGELLSMPAPPSEAARMAVTFLPLVAGVALTVLAFAGGLCGRVMAELRWTFLGSLCLLVLEVQPAAGVLAGIVLLALLRSVASRPDARGNPLVAPPPLPRGSTLGPLAMRASGSLCRVCGGPIGAVFVLCRDCGTPHHEDCWCYAGRCAVYACGCTATVSAS